ncbi:unnamed protein product [Oncorhynchus mykiss]|uniref:Uncharacterized protein n=1 Tax=Oncorhynchus mykiss TaxID=8022 RepID=A0A060WMI0_ONCMY|nr:unnamed protein product [Oncorhynchus mykiss]
MDCVRDFTTREVKPESTCSESCLNDPAHLHALPGVPHRTESRFNGTTAENYRPLNMDITLVVPHPV